MHHAIILSAALQVADPTPRMVRNQYALGGSDHSFADAGSMTYDLCLQDGQSVFLLLFTGLVGQISSGRPGPGAVNEAE